MHVFIWLDETHTSQITGPKVAVNSRVKPGLLHVQQGARVGSQVCHTVMSGWQQSLCLLQQAIYICYQQERLLLDQLLHIGARQERPIMHSHRRASGPGCSGSFNGNSALC